MRKRALALWTALLLALALVAAACGDDDSATEPADEVTTTTAASPAEEVPDDSDADEPADAPADPDDPDDGDADEPAEEPAEEPEDSMATAVAIANDPRLPGPYAVGASSAFVRDYDRDFDLWGERYKNDDVGALIQEVRAAGDPQIIPIQIHYPIEADPAAQVDVSISPPRVLPAAGSAGLTPATNRDFYMDPETFEQIFLPNLASPFDGPPPTEEQWAEAVAMADQLDQVARRSYLGAPIAEGRFPLVFLLHGLGGTATSWITNPEHLASHGYVVVAPSFISDSSSPLVFHDPNSKFADGMDAGATLAAEGRFTSDQPVFRNFFGFMWDTFPRNPFGPGGLDTSGLVAQPGGAAAAAEMMANLFQQRVDDMSSIIAYMDTLNLSAEECSEALDVNGDEHPLCGAFEGSISTTAVGTAGCSLGSITSQVASVQIEQIAAGVGYSNGLPRTWEPPYGTGFPDSSGNADAPDGVFRPFAWLSGSEDAFLDTVWQTIFTISWTGTGGDINEIFPLPAEQLTPTFDNPLPIAASSYQRATGPKINLMGIDANHCIYSDALGLDQPYEMTMGQVQQQPQFPKGDDRSDPDFVPPLVDVLGWEEMDGIQRYIPHDIRNWYTVAMFNTYVKGDDSYAEFLDTDVFDAYAAISTEDIG